MFEEKDLAQFKDRGISRETIEAQIQNFVNGFPYTQLKKPATIGDGIKKYDEENIQAYIREYDEEVQNKRVFKFVPASGAASRMFKQLFSFVETWQGTDAEKDEVDAQNERGTVGHLIKHLPEMALFQDLKASLKAAGEDLEQLRAKREYGRIIEQVLSEEGLNYGNLPKGLLKFHRYPDENRTPVEEHLVEGAHYCADKQGNVFMHFTISPEHEAAFREHLKQVQPEYEKRFNVKYTITFSQQKPSTDTIAVDMDNEPFREEDGSILFRPGGHGALLENLDALDADVVFIKNVDNVVPDRLKEDTYKYKKLIGGVLLIYQRRIFDYLKRFDAGENSVDFITEVAHFVENELCVSLHDDFRFWNSEKKIFYLRSKLDRPLRVCGIVLNTGEPGGGPFWVKNTNDGSVQLQICETAQIDLEDPKQEKLFNKSTHFNPTDLVCAVRNYKGKLYDLMKYRDPKTGFISSKSKNGRELKAQELPGLWNGSMADWNTIFVEVPITTFNPVKTIFDLLREEHI